MSAALPLVNAGASMIDENDVGDHGDHGDHWRICFVPVEDLETMSLDLLFEHPKIF